MDPSISNVEPSVFIKLSNRWRRNCERTFLLPRGWLLWRSFISILNLYFFNYCIDLKVTDCLSQTANLQRQQIQFFFFNINPTNLQCCQHHWVHAAGRTFCFFSSFSLVVTLLLFYSQVIFRKGSFYIFFYLSI